MIYYEVKKDGNILLTVINKKKLLLLSNYKLV